VESILAGDGLWASGSPREHRLYRQIKKHVSFHSSTSKHDDADCELLSTSRSIKVAACYAMNHWIRQRNSKNGKSNQFGVVATIQLDGVSHVDLTNAVQAARAGLQGCFLAFAQNAQEVIVHSHIPDENIVALWEVVKSKPKKRNRFQKSVTFRPLVPVPRRDPEWVTFGMDPMSREELQETYRQESDGEGSECQSDD